MKRCKQFNIIPTNPYMDHSAHISMSGTDSGNEGMGAGAGTGTGTGTGVGVSEASSESNIEEPTTDIDLSFIKDIAQDIGLLDLSDLNTI